MASSFPGNLKLQGDAERGTSPDGTRIIRFIKDNNGHPKSESFGRAIISDPVHLRSGNNQVNLHCELKFRVKSDGFNSTGAGLTFFIAPKDYLVPPVPTGNKYGIFNASDPTPHVFAVVFNSADNTVGINIQSLDPNAQSVVEGGLVDKDVKAVITYKVATQLITVAVYIGGNSQPRPSVSLKYDLGNVVDEYCTVGLSASTGVNAAYHDVLAWTVSPPE